MTELPYSPWSVLTATGALLAFVVGVYTLVGRERKAPYIINSAFKLFLIALVGGAFDVIAAISEWRPLCFLYAGTLVLIAAFFITLLQIYRISRRFTLLSDSIHWRHSSIYRFFKNIRRRHSSKKEYEYNAERLTQDSIDELVERTKASSGKPDAVVLRKDLGSVSLAMALDHHGQSNKVLAALCVGFLKREYTVQYMTASRHPLEFVEYLNVALEEEGMSLQKVADHIIVVDAYTPHFGFADSIYEKTTRVLESQHGVTNLRSRVSFAGVHSASGKAFNIMKERSSSSIRKPTIVIYENMYALSDLESPEQYRVFVRHVLPSERLWGGMFTVFTEVSPAEADWKILSSYASVLIDLRATNDLNR